MAELSVRVHDLTPRNSAQRRLSVVSELCPAQESIPDGNSDFLPDAIAPRGEWREPTTAELSRLMGISGVYGESDLLVIPLPRLAHVLRDQLGSLQDLELTQKAVSDVAFLRALDTCIDDLIPFCVRPDNLLCQGASVNMGGTRLVTHNTVLAPPRRIGLHVDNWDDLPLLERARGRRRLCVNIGIQPRYLLFLQTPISVLAAEGKLPSEIPNDVSPAKLVRAHLGRNLKQLAARVQIDPGEAYIVNADDVIHDGASDAHEALDVALHFLGYFGPLQSH